MDITQLERRLHEAYQELGSAFVDPHEPYYDDHECWLPLSAGVPGAMPGAGLLTEPQHRAIREQCRRLALHNEFAINGHENRISYLVGNGHNYRATMKKGFADQPELTHAVQNVLDDFVFENQWHARQQEIVRRYDRDGEVFLRLFTGRGGQVRVRFIEPGQISTPPAESNNPAASFGILTERDDVETPLAYFIDGQPVDASEIQHRKANVDGNVKRGLPIFFPVRKNLQRAEKLLRNMSVVAEIQSAIALIRKHQQGTRSGVAQFVANQTSAEQVNPMTGQSTSIRRFGPGTILDAPGGIDYDFPAAGLDAASFVAILQAELRAIASRLVMPEFMLTSDASNANYASTMVAEGPAIRMFQRAQAELVAADTSLLWRVISSAANAGALPSAALTMVEIQAAPPTLAVRDKLADAQAFQIELSNGILSPQSWSQKVGLDYDQEQANFLAHQARTAVSKAS